MEAKNIPAGTGERLRRLCQQTKMQTIGGRAWRRGPWRGLLLARHGPEGIGNTQHQQGEQSGKHETFAVHDTPGRKKVSKLNCRRTSVSKLS